MDTCFGDAEIAGIIEVKELKRQFIQPVEKMIFFSLGCGIMHGGYYVRINYISSPHVCVYLWVGVVYVCK